MQMIMIIPPPVPKVLCSRPAKCCCRSGSSFPERTGLRIGALATNRPSKWFGVHVARARSILFYCPYLTSLMKVYILYMAYINALISNSLKWEVKSKCCMQFQSGWAGLPGTQSFPRGCQQLEAAGVPRCPLCRRWWLNACCPHWPTRWWAWQQRCPIGPLHGAGRRTVR